ncbi:transglycosylase SLT domain-containing protein [Vibrio mediterranei]|uniref:transglycosylase SLT domain-containing protein n=1 Tax=Vibrio mediterranei TaxID=689 RepID=UPI004068E578
MKSKWIIAICMTLGSSFASAQCIPNFFKVAARSVGVPVDVFYALAYQESATKMTTGQVKPWPYSMNYLGKTYVFADYKSLVHGASKLLSEGKEAFDVGYWQVNYKWNRERFSNIGHLAHPAINARVAGEIFRERYNQYGDWVKAAGRYHNPNNNGGKADKYARSYKKWLQKVRKEYHC